MVILAVRGLPLKIGVLGSGIQGLKHQRVHTQRFRQGFGRLIRSKKDFGVMIVLDNRVLKKDYGAMFLQALPDNVTLEKMKLAEIPGKVKEWLDIWRVNGRGGEN